MDLSIDAGRLLYGLSRIGYTTSAALCDIVDNSVRAKADKINLIIRKEREELSDNRINNVKEYLIVDDGHGMDKDGIEAALTIGSTAQDYEADSLSKFGLGLKAASFSQGDVLKVISSDGNSPFTKIEVSLPKVMDSGRYTGEETDISVYEQKIIEEYLSVNNKGTIVIISEIRKNNHPSVKNTLKELKKKMGVIYYYFLIENLSIWINDNEIKAVDPLFAKEADENGNLNENDWDGTSVRWIEKSTELPLDDEEGVNITIEITQLPYPPIFKLKNLGDPEDKTVREKYMIESGNYGFYVYRNNRLISWASHLQGILPYDQDYYSFRGRILIDDEADDFFNIDVKKSTLTLSDEAWNTISDFVVEAKSKSKSAWKNANRIRREIINKDPNEIANKLLDEFEQLDLLPGDQILDEEDVLSRIRAIKVDMANKISVIFRMMKEDAGEEVDENAEISDDDKELAIKGEKNPEITKIFRVTSVEDNNLWEPYYDTDLGECVRINRFHRFARLIYEENQENEDMQVIFDLMLLQIAQSELYAYKNIGGHDYSLLKSIISEYRRIVSEFLAHMCRRLDDKLPPHYESDM